MGHNWGNNSWPRNRYRRRINHPYCQEATRLIHIADHEIIFTQPRIENSPNYSRGRIQAAMVTNFVQSLRSEIDALEDSLKASPDPRVVKLQELKKLLALYGDPTTSGIGLNAAEPRPTRKWGRPEKAPGAPHKPGRKISRSAKPPLRGLLKSSTSRQGRLKRPTFMQCCPRPGSQSAAPIR